MSGLIDMTERGLVSLRSIPGTARPSCGGSRSQPQEAVVYIGGGLLLLILIVIILAMVLR
jgi:hypothetical protein